MRVQESNGSSELFYLLTDHLGSTALTVDTNGNKVAELRYMPWGETRYTWGTTPTDYTYTGQRSEMDSIGLMYYNARWYDPALGRFAQADTIVPGMHPMAFDRYSYAYNNPVKYNDPSGHWGAACTNPMIVGASRTPLEGLLVHTEILQVFDPLMGPYVDEYINGEFDEETFEQLERIWFGTARAYVERNRDLNSIAKQGKRNPLLPEEANAVIEGDVRIEQTLINNYNHTPFNVFLTILGVRMRRNFFPESSGSYMQFESNYLKALMAAHPDELREAMLIYQEYKASFDGKEQREEILAEIAEKLVLGGTE